jgi:hypothetical protein
MWNLIALTVIHIHVFLLTVTPKSADNYIAVYTGRVGPEFSNKNVCSKRISVKLKHKARVFRHPAKSNFFPWSLGVSEDAMGVIRKY